MLTDTTVVDGMGAVTYCRCSGEYMTGVKNAHSAPAKGKLDGGAGCRGGYDICRTQSQGGAKA